MGEKRNRQGERVWIYIKDGLIINTVIAIMPVVQ